MIRPPTNISDTAPIAVSSFASESITEIIIGRSWFNDNKCSLWLPLFKPYQRTARSQNLATAVPSVAVELRLRAGIVGSARGSIDIVARSVIKNIKALEFADLNRPSYWGR